MRATFDYVVVKNAIFLKVAAKHLKSIKNDRKWRLNLKIRSKFGPSDRDRTCGIDIPNGKRYLIYRRFRSFLTLSAQNHILFGAFISVVSVCSGCRCGINCGQKTTSQSLNFLNTGGCFFFLYQKLIRSKQRRNVFSSQPVRRQQAKHGSNFAKCRNTQNSRKCILTCDIGYIEVKAEM